MNDWTDAGGSCCCQLPVLLTEPPLTCFCTLRCLCVCVWGLCVSVCVYAHARCVCVWGSVGGQCVFFRSSGRVVVVGQKDLCSLEVCFCVSSILLEVLV